MLLEPIKRASFFLRRCEHPLALVKITVDKLMLEKLVSVAFTHKFSVGLLVSLHVELDLLSEALLNRVEFNQVLLKLRLLFDPLRCVVVLDQLLELA